MPSQAMACAATFLPSRCASSTIAFISGLVNLTQERSGSVWVGGLVVPAVRVELDPVGAVLDCSRTALRTPRLHPHQDAFGHAQLPGIAGERIHPVGAIASVETNSRGPGTTPRAIAVFRLGGRVHRAFGAQVAKRGESVHERDPGRRGGRARCVGMLSLSSCSRIGGSDVALQEETCVCASDQAGQEPGIPQVDDP